MIVTIRKNEDEVVSYRVESSTCNWQVKSLSSTEEGTKSALLENKKTLKVPTYIAVGDWISVNIDKEEFVSRADGPTQRQAHQEQETSDSDVSSDEEE